jgi:hypothetical protein
MPFNSNYYNASTTPDENACNGRSSPYNYVAGENTKISHAIHLVSSPLSEIVRASFNEQAGSDEEGFYHRDFKQAYDPTVSKTGGNVGFIDSYSSDDSFTVKQLNGLGVVTGVGKCMRWIAGDNPPNNQTEGYIKVTSALDFVSSGEDAGVLFQNHAGFSTSWGSSVGSISVLRKVFRFRIAELNSGDSNEAEGIVLNVPYNYGTIAGTGTITEVNIKRLPINGEGEGGSLQQIASGYIFALKSGSGENPVTYPHVHILNGSPPHDGNIQNGTEVRTEDTANYSDTTNERYFIEAKNEKDSQGNPCFRYEIKSAYRFDVGDTADTFKRIQFTENGGNTSFTSYDLGVDPEYLRVFQYEWDNITSDQAATRDAVPYAFIRDETALYVDECDPSKPFLREYGPIYQNTGSVYIVWGNRSFNTTRTKFDSRLTGRFVNIAHNINNLYVNGEDYNENWDGGGENLVQVLARQLSYESTYNYVPGEKIFQIRSSEDYDYASATVVSWEFPDLTNPSDTSPMILLARIDKVGPAQPGNYIDVDNFQELQDFKVGGSATLPVADFLYDGKIIPLRLLSSTEPLVENWPYEVTGSNVFFSDRKVANNTQFPVIAESPLPVTVGTTRIRCISLGANPLTDDGDIDVLYKFYLFDIQLTESNSIFGDVTDIVYDIETDAKNIIKIAQASGRREVEETFSGTSQTITTRKTVIYDPSKDKLFFKIPTGRVFERVLSNQNLTVELQKVFNHTFSDVNDNSWTVGDVNDRFLASEPNINWFAINSKTGLTYNLVEGTEPSYVENELGFEINTSSGELKLYAPEQLSTDVTDVTLFAKTQRTFDTSNIRKKTLKTATEIISGFTKGSTKSLKNQYYMELMTPSSMDSLQIKPGQISSVISVYPVDENDLIRTGAQNIVSSFVLDTGITDQVIGRPKVILSSGYVKANGTEVEGSIFGSVTDPSAVRLKITYEYYEYDTVESNISVRESFIDSSETVISNFDVPFYFSKNNGEAIHESAIIDFRPNNLNSVDDFFLGESKITPHPDWADEINASYYLPRRDKLILTRDGKFEVVYGKPSMSPRYPSDVPNSMSIYLIEKDPFIFGPSSVKTKMIDNRRYTMRDIGKIEKRVQKLEYYTTLSVLEKKAEDLLVLDANGNDRFKNGILVDTFEGHRIGDVTNRDYNISIDFTNRYARPPFTTHTNNFIVDSTGSTTFVGLSTQTDGIYKDLYMFPYEEVVFIAQPLATRALSVQPHDTVQYEGVVNLVPTIDTWVSTVRRPDVNVNLAGENDAWEQMVSAFNNNNLAPFGTQWEEWETLSRNGTRTVIDSETSTRVVRDWHLVKPGHAHGGSGAGRDERTIENITTNTVLVNEELEQVRNGITRTLSTSTTDVSLGDRVVDVRLVPFMREKNIKIIGSGLKPKTRVYVFFDGTNVEEYCYKYDSVSALYGNSASTESSQALLPYPGSEFGLGNGGTHFATGASEDLKTDENGFIYVEFRMPDGMFRVGDRKFEITSDSRNNAERASTYAFGIYSASGLRTEVEETIATTRNFQISNPIQASETRNTTFTGVFTETTSNTVVQTRQNDPLAQTFLVNASEHPEGIFISSVDIFFARKPENTTNLPVQIQIRPVVNGYPDSTRIYPGAKVVKLPSEVQVSEDASAKTTFTFDYPIHLPPGEHALIVKGDTSEYEIFVATLGDFILGTETKVTNQPYVGVFFTSANASAWTAEQNTDMMFVMNKCEFQVGVNRQIVLKNEVIQTENKFELLNINSRYFDFNSCRSNWTVVAVPSSEGGSPVTLSVEPNSNIELSNTYSYGTRTGSTSTEIPLRLTINCETTNKDVCPVIDLQSLSFYAINNLVESNDSANNGEINPFVPVTTGTPRARYISRVVTLEDGFDSNNMKVVLSVSKPIGTNIQVFVKTQDTESTDDFHSFGYTQLTSNVQNFDSYYTQGEEFREIEFNLPSDTTTPFNKFCVKVCLYSNLPWNVPKIRDLRAVAVL